MCSGTDDRVHVPSTGMRILSTEAAETWKAPRLNSEPDSDDALRWGRRYLISSQGVERPLGESIAALTDWADSAGPCVCYLLGSRLGARAGISA